ncbi:hypothetical protein AQJ23_21255 [Streptomyces antibioticus]|nr:hypothetical protein [Streptomyces antibioticus]KUN24117.1 hypothetical protein AQJ23_21255 [Streptomyces antibioticus]
MTGSPNGRGGEGCLPVEEEGVEMDPRRPRVITVASWLLISSAVFWLPVIGGLLDPALRQTAGWMLFAHVVFAVRARRNRWKARIAVTVAAVALLLALGPLAQGFTSPEYPYGVEYAVLDVVAVVLSATGVALLHGHRGNAYFRRRP